jgi:hypothetical protein
MKEHGNADYTHVMRPIREAITEVLIPNMERIKTKSENPRVCVHADCIAYAEWECEKCFDIRDSPEDGFFCSQHAGFHLCPHEDVSKTRDIQGDYGRLVVGDDFQVKFDYALGMEQVKRCKMHARDSRTLDSEHLCHR